MDYYRVTVEIFGAGNARPESRHQFIIEAAGDEIWQATDEARAGQNTEEAEREAALTAAIEDLTGEFLEAHQLLSVPFVGTPTVRRAATAPRELPERPPDLARGGVKLWYLGARPGSNHQRPG